MGLFLLLWTRNAFVLRPVLLEALDGRAGWPQNAIREAFGPLALAHPAPEAMFADADHVMIARMSMVQPTADRMRELDGAWLDQSYGERVEMLYWTRWSHRIRPPGSATQAS